MSLESNYYELSPGAGSVLGIYSSDVVRDNILPGLIAAGHGQSASDDRGNSGPYHGVEDYQAVLLALIASLLLQEPHVVRSTYDALLPSLSKIIAAKDSFTLNDFPLQEALHNFGLSFKREYSSEDSLLIYHFIVTTFHKHINRVHGMINVALTVQVLQNVLLFSGSRRRLGSLELLLAEFFDKNSINVKEDVSHDRKRLSARLEELSFYQFCKAYHQSTRDYFAGIKPLKLVEEEERKAADLLREKLEAQRRDMEEDASGDTLGDIPVLAMREQFAQQKTSKMSFNFSKSTNFAKKTVVAAGEGAGIDALEPSAAVASVLDSHDLGVLKDKGPGPSADAAIDPSTQTTGAKSILDAFDAPPVARRPATTTAAVVDRLDAKSKPLGGAAYGDVSAASVDPTVKSGVRSALDDFDFLPPPPPPARRVQPPPAAPAPSAAAAAAAEPPNAFDVFDSSNIRRR